MTRFLILQKENYTIGRTLDLAVTLTVHNTDFEHAIILTRLCTFRLHNKLNSPDGRKVAVEFSQCQAQQRTLKK